jgi:hypothetical protein
MQAAAAFLPRRDRARSSSKKAIRPTLDNAHHRDGACFVSQKDHIPRFFLSRVEMEFALTHLEPSSCRSSSMVDAVVQRFSRRVQNCLPVDTVLALDALVDATIDVIRRHHLSVQSRETDAAALQSIKRIRTALDLAGKAGLGSTAARQRDRLDQALLDWKNALRGDTDHDAYPPSHALNAVGTGARPDRQYKL